MSATPTPAGKKTVNGEYAKLMRAIVTLGILVLTALGVGVAGFVTPGARADPFTGKQGRELEQRVLKGIESIEVRLHDHEILPYHTQAGVSLSDVQAQLRALSADMSEVKKDVREIRNRQGGE